MATTRYAAREWTLENARVLNGGDRAIWHKSAPSAVRRAFSAGDHPEGWAAWKKHLARRKRPADPARLLPGKGEPLSWGLPDGLDSCRRPAWLDRAEQLLRDRQPPDPSLDKDVLAWLGDATGNQAEVGCVLEAMAGCRALPRLAAVLPADVWFALLDHLLGVVADAGGIDLETEPLLHQLLAGELALTLAYLLPEIVPCRKLKRSARRALSSGLVDLLDGEGMPHGKHLAMLRPLLASWTRCRAFGDELKGGCWSASADEQYGWLVHHALRLVRHDGSHVFSNALAKDWSEELFQAALRFGGDDDDRRIAAVVLPSREKSRKKSRKTKLRGAGLPRPATHSEWASVAVLRPAWSRRGERLTVVYAGQSVRMEFSCGKDILWSGPWELDVRVDGQPMAPTSDWEQLCWISDEDVDFLELEIELGSVVRGGPALRVQRQMALAREDRFLLLADVVMSDRPAELEYRGCLPLWSGVSFQGADETREGYLAGGKPRASVLPLALPEWRSEQRIGELAQTDRGLELSQSYEGRGLYAPLFFDLDRRRQTYPSTWRHLTVAESLAAQPVDVAVGYRVAAGIEQWLIYRSLAEKANRTLLGHNLSTEILLARFDRSGKVKPLLEIE